MGIQDKIKAGEALLALERARQREAAEAMNAGIRAQYRATRGLPEPAETDGTPVLTDTQRRMLEILQTLPEGEGRTGKQIANELGIGDESTVRGHLLRGLRAAGYQIENRPGAGYFLKR